MIVANKNNLNEQEKKLTTINKQKQCQGASFYSLRNTIKDVGSHNDSQDITNTCHQDKDKNTLQNFIKLDDRKTGQKLDLTDKGIIISEKLADYNRCFCR